MSGGSYDKLCFREVETLLGDTISDDLLQAMFDRLKELGYADDAAAQTLAVLKTIQETRARLNELCGPGFGSRLSPIRKVWKALEWWESGDDSEAELHKALVMYRQGKCAEGG